MKVFVSLSLLFLAFPSGAQPPNVEVLGELQVSTELSTYIFPFDIAVSHDENDGFVVSWASYNTLDGSIADILARRYDVQGQDMGAEFLVNQETADVQQRPTLSHAPDGSFVVVWQDFAGGPIMSLGIAAQRLDPLGMPLGAQVAVDDLPNDQDRPSVSHAPDGSFLVAWHAGGAVDGSALGVRARQYDAAGGPIGAELQVNGYTQGSQASPRVSHGEDGSFTVAWSGAADGLISAVQARQFDQTGSPIGADFLVSTASYGSFGSTDISRGTDGGFVIVWTGRNGPAGANGIQARLYDPFGQPSGQPFRVDSGMSDSLSVPKVSHGEDGIFVITWAARDAQDSTDIDVQARLYDSLGVPIGEEFQVNDNGIGEQAFPDVSHGPDGLFVVVWSDHQGFGETMVRAKIYRVDLGLPMSTFDVEVPAIGPYGAVALAVLLASIGARRIRRRQ